MFCRLQALLQTHDIALPQVVTFNHEAITWYIQHPVPIEPPAEEQPPAAMPLMLTAKVIFCPADVVAWPTCSAVQAALAAL